MVRYADYDEIRPEVFLNGVTPYIFKRKSFEHERELRVLLWFQATADGEGNYPREAADVGRAVSADLVDLIEGIYVSPLAERWFAELVHTLVTAYGLPCAVIQSHLYTRPDHLAANFEHLADVSQYLTDAVVDHLHVQHLQYIDQKHRERERLSRRQYVVIERWLRSIERDVERITYNDAIGCEHLAKQAMLTFADDILHRPLKEIVPLTLFRVIFSITGRFANAFNALQTAVLPPDELLLLIKRFFTLYCETVYSTHVAILSKRDEPVDREDDAAMVQMMADQGLTFIRLMKELKI